MSYFHLNWFKQSDIIKDLYDKQLVKVLCLYQIDSGYRCERTQFAVLLINLYFIFNSFETRLYFEIEKN